MSDKDIVVDVCAAVPMKGEGALEMSFFSYPVTLKLYGFDQARQLNRRYSDFDALRSQLSATYWACIIPPVPAKQSALDQLSKIAPANKTEADILEYRRIALRRFLSHVARHPLLGHSTLLRMFTDDAQWRQCLREPVKPPRFIALSFTDELTKSWMAGSVAREVAAAAYSRAVKGGGAGMDMGGWDAMRVYVAQLEGALRKLRERVHSLIQRRRSTAAALIDFGEAFGFLAEAEEDAGMHQAVVAVQQSSCGVGGLYNRGADTEAQMVESMLSYHMGVWAAVQEAMRHVYATTQHVEQLGRKAQELEVQIAKGGPNTDHNRAELYCTVDQRQRTEAQLREAEKMFKDDFAYFHRDNMVDMKQLLKTFGELEEGLVDDVKNTWQHLSNTVQELTPS